MTTSVEEGDGRAEVRGAGREPLQEWPQGAAGEAGPGLGLGLTTGARQRHAVYPSNATEHLTKYQCTGRALSQYRAASPASVSFLLLSHRGGCPIIGSDEAAFYHHYIVLRF